MEKMLKKIKVFALILMIILISLIAFVGVFVKDKGVWSNVLPDYEYGMDLEGARELKYALDTSEEEKTVYVDENGNIKGEVWEDGTPISEEHDHEHEEEAETTEEPAEETTEKEGIPYAQEKRIVKANPDDQMTKENFELAKKIIQERLEAQGIEEFNIRLDDITGKLVIETANNNENVDLVKSLVYEKGKLQIIDHQNGLILIDNSDIKNVGVVTSNDSEYNTYLQVEFNKQGAEKLREISTKYVETKSEEESEEEHAEHTEGEHSEVENEHGEIKYVSLVFDDTTMMSTYFAEEMTNGILQINVGQPRTNYDEFLEDYESAQTIADIINSGVLPVAYELETDNFVKSEITTKSIQTLKIAVAVAMAIASVIFIIKYKKNGVIGSILAIGFIAVLSIVVRYTNAVLTVNSMVVYMLIIVMNYIFTKMILERLKTAEISQAYNDVAKQFYLSIIPLIAISIVFTLTSFVQISSIGMIMFWGIIINVLYNLIFAKRVF